MSQILFTDPIPQATPNTRQGIPYGLHRTVELKSDRGRTIILSMAACYYPLTGEAQIDLVKSTEVSVSGNESRHYNIEEARQVIAEYDKWFAELKKHE